MKFEQWTYHQNANTANSEHGTSLNKKEIIKKKKLGRKKSNKFLFWLIYTEITIKQKIRLLRIRICTCQFQGRAVDKAYFRTI